MIKLSLEMILFWCLLSLIIGWLLFFLNRKVSHVGTSKSNKKKLIEILNNTFHLSRKLRSTCLTSKTSNNTLRENVSSNRHRCSRLVSISRKFWGEEQGGWEGKRRRNATTSRDRGGIRGISPIKIDGRQDGGGARKWSPPGSSAQKVLTRNVLWCGSFANWNRLSGAGSAVFPRRRDSTSTDHSLPPFLTRLSRSRGWKRLTITGSSLRRFSNIRISRGKRAYNFEIEKFFSIGAYVWHLWRLECGYWNFWQNGLYVYRDLFVSNACENQISYI